MNRTFAGGIFALLCCLVATLSGCWMPSISRLGSGPAIDTAKGGDPAITPFQLDIISEKNNNDVLVIEGQLSPKTQWSSEEVLVRLTALDDTGEQRVALHRFSDISPSGTLEARVPARFELSLPSQGLSNYQVEALWGKDASPYMETPKASMKSPKPEDQYLALRALEVHRVPDGSCSSPEECLVRFSLKGEFFNSGEASVQNVVVEAGFSPVDKLDLPNQILENKRRIEVRNLRLAPGATKPFRLTLEKFVPASDDVAYQPVVRIVSFEAS